MAVLVVCPKCGNKIKAAEHQVGKKAKCPQCKEVITLEPAPGGESPTIAFNSGTTAMLTKPVMKAAGSSKQTEKAEWKVMTGEQEEYGPVTKTDLDAWVTDGRLDKECQLLKDGWEQWKWADEVYPELAVDGSSAGLPVAPIPAGPANPFPGVAAPAPASGPSNPFGALGGAAPKPPAVNAAPPAFAPAAPAAAVNPYSSPSPAGLGVAPAPSASGGMTGEVATGVLRALKDTQTWVLVFVILTGLSFLLSAGGALVIFIASVMAVGARAVLTLVMFAPSVVMSGVFAWLLFSYYSAIGDVSRIPTNAHLQKAMEAQQRFWMVAALTVIVSIVLQVILGLVMSAMMASLMNNAAPRGMNDFRGIP